MTDVKVAKQCADRLSALAEVNRLRVIDILRSGEKNVTELATLMNVEIVNVSHHLGVLRASELVLDRKEGRFVIYSLNPQFFTFDATNATYLDLGWCKIEIPHN